VWLYGGEGSRNRLDLPIPPYLPLRVDPKPRDGRVAQTLPEMVAPV
jgi:hypothetical protein